MSDDKVPAVAASAAPAAASSSSGAGAPGGPAAPAGEGEAAAAGGGEGGEGASEPLNPNRVKVKKWNAVAFWSYDIENDTCAICHNQLMVPCFTPEHQVLTNEGFKFVHELKSGASSSLLFASFDPTKKTVEYLPSAGALIEQQSKTVVEFTDVNESFSWNKDSDKYGRNSARTKEVEAINAEKIKPQGNHVSIIVTPDHNMYARKGSLDAEDRGRWHDDPFKLVKAADLFAPKIYSSDGPGHKRGDSYPADKHCVQFVGNVDNGLADVGAKLPFVDVLKLDSEEKIVAFLEFYGYWLGDGSFDVTGKRVTAHPRKAADKVFIREKLDKIGLVHKRDFHVNDSKDGHSVFYIVAANWFEYFLAEYGAKYVGGSSVQYVSADGSKLEETASVKCYWAWVWSLPKKHACAVIEGLHQADGIMTNNTIYTSSARFRDDTIRLLLHAGFSAFFTLGYPAGTIRGYYVKGSNDGKIFNEADMKAAEAEEGVEFLPVRATVDVWIVHYTDYNMAKQTIVAKEMKEVVYNGPVWCVSVPPHNTLIARRAFLDEQGVVTKASRPIIVGNCITCEAEPHHAEDCSVAWGQCLAKGSLVVQADGATVRVEDLQVKDRLLGTDQSVVSVTMVKNGVSDVMYRMVDDSGRELVMTPNHLVTLSWRSGPCVEHTDGSVIANWTDPVTLKMMSKKWSYDPDAARVEWCHESNAASELVLKGYSRSEAEKVAQDYLDVTEKLALGDLVEITAAEFFTRREELGGAELGGNGCAQVRTRLVVVPAEVSGRPVTMIKSPSSSPSASSEKIVVQAAHQLIEGAVGENLTQMVLGDGQYRAVKVDDKINCKVVNVFQNPLTSVAIVNKDGQKAFTTKVLERAWSACGIKVDEHHGYVMTEVNPIPSETGEMPSDHKKYDDMCAANILQAVSMHPKVIVAYGRMARMHFREMIEAPPMCVQILKPFCQDHAKIRYTDQENGVWDIDIMFTYHPSYYKKYEDVLSTVKKAHELAFPSEHVIVPDDAVERVTSSKIVSFDKVIKNAQEYVEIQVDGDHRYALANGLLTHNCGHSYHFHCITRWLKTRSTCPLDDEEWDFVQY